MASTADARTSPDWKRAWGRSGPNPRVFLREDVVEGERGGGTEWARACVARPAKASVTVVRPRMVSDSDTRG